MDTVFTSWFFVLIFWFSSMFTVEFATHVARDYQVKEVTEFATEEIQNHGGYTIEVQKNIQERMDQLGLVEAGYQVEAPSEKVNFEERFTVKIAGEYTYRAFNLLGSEVGNYTVPVSSTGVGLGQVYFRN